MQTRFIALLSVLLICISPASADELADSVKQDYDEYLADLWDHFHRNPELSLVEFETAKRMAAELRAAGFTVTEGVGGTGLVAMLENGSGPLVMMRADMDGLPVEEKSGLPNSSVATQEDPITGNVVSVMHACGHDVHITSLVGTARQMVARKNDWSGTLMRWCSPPKNG
jgi:metal-dependent amidase/aminoacylase/carboxypeptidase family protein